MLPELAAPAPPKIVKADQITKNKAFWTKLALVSCRKKAQPVSKVTLGVGTVRWDRVLGSDSQSEQRRTALNLKALSRLRSHHQPHQGELKSSDPEGHPPALSVVL